MTEWPKVTDCKSVGFYQRGFESHSFHFLKIYFFNFELLSRKTNAVGLRLGIRKAWLAPLNVDDYKRQLNYYFSAKEFKENLIKRFRWHKIFYRFLIKNNKIFSNYFFLKRRVRRQGSIKTIRRRLKLRWRRWARSGARSIERFRYFIVPFWRPRYYSKPKSFTRNGIRFYNLKYFINFSYWEKIKRENSRIAWRYLVFRRFRRHRRHLFFVHLNRYTKKQLRSHLPVNLRSRFIVLRSPAFRTVHTIHSSFRRAPKAWRRFSFPKWFKKALTKFSRLLFFRRATKRFLDMPTRIKWKKNVLIRNSARFTLALASALWLPSARVFCNIWCIGLKSYRKQWIFTRFIDFLTLRLQGFNFGLKGIRVEIRGKFNKRLRTVKVVRRYGFRNLPLNTFDTKCDYWFGESYTYLGVFSVRVWFYLIDAPLRSLSSTRKSFFKTKKFYDNNYLLNGEREELYEKIRDQMKLNQKKFDSFFNKSTPQREPFFKFKSWNQYLLATDKKYRRYYIKKKKREHYLRKLQAQKAKNELKKKNNVDTRGAKVQKISKKPAYKKR